MNRIFLIIDQHWVGLGKEGGERRGGEGREKEWMTWLDTLSSVVHCVSFTDHDMHVVAEHCRKE